MSTCVCGGVIVCVCICACVCVCVCVCMCVIMSSEVMLCSVKQMTSKIRQKTKLTFPETNSTVDFLLIQC